jgi:hypothetical protein
VIDHLNILLVPEVNKLLGYLTDVGDKRKENICESLNFICVLITAIGYYGDGEDNERQSNTSEVVRNWIEKK